MKIVNFYIEITFTEYRFIPRDFRTSLMTSG